MPKDANQGYSTFFPDAMTPQEVIDAINEAYGNRVMLYEKNEVYVGFAANGMEVIMFIGKGGKIISAFPYGNEDNVLNSQRRSV